MQFSTIIAAISFALVASASPVLVERTTPAEDVQNKCGASATASCCNSVLKGILPIGVDCVALNLISLGPVSQQCSATQVVTCCNGGSQTGAINVGTICAPIVL